VLKFVRRHQDGPFFVYYPMVLPHLALQAPEEEIAHYRGRWPETHYEGDHYLPHPTPRACYAAMISFQDKQVGRLMVLLKELKIDENTIVLDTSDNGTTHLEDEVDYTFFESVGPLRGLKGSLHEGGIRVPMIARWPGHVPAGSQTDHLAAHYDLLATIADLAGITTPPKTDGISFVPRLEDAGPSAQQPTHDYLFWDFAGYGGQLAMRMGRWKGIKKDLRKDPQESLELYDLDTDLGETNNVAGNQPEIAMNMEKLMLDARTQPEIESFRFGIYRP
jgi:arylsulfatase